MINIRDLVKIAIKQGVFELHLLEGSSPVPDITPELVLVPIQEVSPSSAMREETLKYITLERYRDFNQNSDCGGI